MMIPLLRPAMGALTLLISGSLSLAAQESPKPKGKTAPAAPTAKAPLMEPRTKGKLKPVDINTATLEEIGFMLGIDRDLAARIVAGRPYLTKTRLYTKKILTKEQYLALKDRVMVKK